MTTDHYDSIFLNNMVKREFCGRYLTSLYRVYQDSLPIKVTADCLNTVPIKTPSGDWLSKQTISIRSPAFTKEPGKLNLAFI